MRSFAGSCLMLLIAASSAVAQGVHLDLTGGPTWRGTQGGRYRQAFDALTLEAALARRIGSRLAVRATAGFTVGEASEAIAIGAPCDRSPCPGGGLLGTVVPGSSYHGGLGVIWTVPVGGARLEARTGASLHTASVSGPDAVLGIDAGVSVAVLRWLHLGVDATRLTSDLGLMRWLVTPAIRLRLGSRSR